MPLPLFLAHWEAGRPVEEEDPRVEAGGSCLEMEAMALEAVMVLAVMVLVAEGPPGVEAQSSQPEGLRGVEAGLRRLVEGVESVPQVGRLGLGVAPQRGQEDLGGQKVGRERQRVAKGGHGLQLQVARLVQVGWNEAHLETVQPVAELEVEQEGWRARDRVLVYPCSLYG